MLSHCMSLCSAQFLSLSASRILLWTCRSVWAFPYSACNPPCLTWPQTASRNLPPTIIQWSSWAWHGSWELQGAMVAFRIFSASCACALNLHIKRFKRCPVTKKKTISFSERSSTTVSSSLKTSFNILNSIHYATYSTMYNSHLIGLARRLR